LKEMQSVNLNNEKKLKDWFDTLLKNQDLVKYFVSKVLILTNITNLDDPLPS